MTQTAILQTPFLHKKQRITLMNIKTVLFPAAAVLALTACTTGSTVHPVTDSQAAVRAAEQKDKVFVCKNRMKATVRSIDNERIALMVDKLNSLTELTRDVSGSGVRYTSTRGIHDQPTEWHMKNTKAFFSFIDQNGRHVETSCEIK